MASNISFTLLLCFGILSKFDAQTYVHIVTDRDDIYRLSRVYDIPAADLAKVNHLDSVGQPLLLYQKLIIPDKYQSKDKYGIKQTKTIKHLVKPKESLYSIARHYGVTVYDLLIWNPKIERGKTLDENEVVKVVVTTNSKNQYSQQIIYLNGELIHYDSLTLTEENKEAVNRLNSSLDDRIVELTDYKMDNSIIDSFYLPTNDTNKMSRLFYTLILFGIDSSIEKQAWLDSVYEELFYIRSEIKIVHVKSDKNFLIKAFSMIHELNQKFPQNDFLFSVRSLMYYWIGNYKKAAIFTDETLSLNPSNQSALMVNAAILLQQNHCDRAITEFQKLELSLSRLRCIQYNIATAYYFKYDYLNTIDNYTPMIENSPDLMPELNFRLGKCFILLGDDNYGCEFLREATKQKYPGAEPLKLRHCK